jgi:hypothetical protein
MMPVLAVPPGRRAVIAIVSLNLSRERLYSSRAGIAFEDGTIFGFEDTEAIRNSIGGHILAFDLPEAGQANFATPRTMHSFSPVIGHRNLCLPVTYGDQSIADALNCSLSKT